MYNDFYEFLSEADQYGLERRATAFRYWECQYQFKKKGKKIARSDFEGRKRNWPSYELETIIFMMARYADEAWERLIVIETFSKEYTGEK